MRNTRFDRVSLEMGIREDSLRADLAQAFEAPDSRIDRLVLTLVAGLLAIIATMIAQNIF